MSLDVRQLTKAFDKTLVVSDLNLRSHESEFITLVGRSGCGKTTLLRLIAGLEKPDAGQILVRGKSIEKLAPRNRNLSMVFQSESLYPHLSVRQNLEFPLRMRKYPREEIRSRAERVAQTYQVQDLLDRLPETLSGGQRQRVALGRAMVREPAICLLDEPFSNLDIHLRKAFRTELLQRKQEWSCTTILVTHDIEEAFQLGDRVAVMANGVIHQLATPEEITRHPASALVEDFLSKP